MYAISPKGTKIIGTLELIPGVAMAIVDGFKRLPSGKIDVEYEGETDVDWGGQETVQRNDAAGKPQTVFVDEDGDEFLASEITLVEDDPDDEEDDEEGDE